jgi:glyoxylase-like metal-dependent hydrolase (beta-lactamase superfamily II)
MATYVAPGVLELDTLLGGWENVTAAYLLEGPAPVLVETGSQSSAAHLARALADLGLRPDDLAGIAVTHVHLDHAGAVGDLARAFPRATVYVHPRGARHLAEPSRLVASAATVYGDLLGTLYGGLEPTEAGRIKALEDGEAIPLGGGRELLGLHSPGHAKHHMAFCDSATGVLFVGDAAGVKLPGAGPLRPATPPTDFDLGQALHSLERFAHLAPGAVALAHYGLLPGDPVTALQEAADVLREWASVAEAAWGAGRDIEQALRRRYGPLLEELPEPQRQRVEVLNGIHSNAQGLGLWLSRSHARPDVNKAT